jgi:hypothetical protein
MQDQFQGRDDRYGKTIRKNLTLTQEAIEAIEAYAERHNLYFSVAVETLAMMALGRNTAETLPRLTANMLERTTLWHFNRLATLLAETITVAEEVNFKADFLTLQTMWREARVDPDDFTEKLLVSCKPEVEPDNQVRRLHEELKEMARQAGRSRREAAPAQLANSSANTSANTLANTLAIEGGAADE